MVQGPRHAGPRPRVSWWRGPWPPLILITTGLVLIGWELTVLGGA